MLLLQQMLVLFIYMIFGYVAYKKGFLKEEASSAFSWVVVNVANPALIISSAVNGDGSIHGKELLYTFGLSVVVYAVLILLSQTIPRLFYKEGPQRNLYQMMMVFNNIGFMGFPVISATYGDNALLYASVFLLTYNILQYTYGIQTLQKGTENASGLQWKKIFNIGVISCIIATFLYLTQIPVPEVIKTASKGLSNLTGPLSMIVIGISLAKMRIRDLFSDKKLLVFSAVKLLIVPIIGASLISRVISNQLLSEVCMIILATPAASMTVMLVEQYGGDQKLAAKTVALTTLLSVVTIPIVSAIVF